MSLLRVFLAITLLASAGCRLLDRDKISGTMGYQKQMAEITRIAPYGTPREESVSRLEKAGIAGEYSRAGKSIYYCYLWNRSDGKRWHMTVSLLFNAQGEFYAVNLADADIKEETGGESPMIAPPRGSTGTKPSQPARSKSPVPWPEQREKSGPAFPEPAPTDRRAGRRTPFDEVQR